MQIDNPLKVNIGNFYLVDFEYLENYAIMILEDSIPNEKFDKYQSMAKKDNNGRQNSSIPDIFTRTIAHQSISKLSRLHGLQKTKYTTISSMNMTPSRPAGQTPGTLASFTACHGRPARLADVGRPATGSGMSVTASDMPVHSLLPVVGGCSSIVAKTVRHVRSMNASTIMLDGDGVDRAGVSSVDLSTIFVIDNDAPWNELQEDVFKDYYGSVFERKIKKGEVYKLSVKRPEDLQEVPDSQLAKEYVKFISSGKEKAMLNYLFKQSELKPRQPKVEIRLPQPTGKQSNHLKSMDTILNKFKKQLIKLSDKKADLDVCQASLHSDIEVTLQQSQLQSRSKLIRQKAYMDAISPDSHLNMPGGVSRIDKLARIRDKSVNYEKARLKVVHRKGASLDSKLRRLDEMIKLKKPQDNHNEQSQLKVYTYDI